MFEVDVKNVTEKGRSEGGMGRRTIRVLLQKHNFNKII